jgi:hypothetical protein
MPIKKRKLILPPKKRLIIRKAKKRANDLERLGQFLEQGHGDKQAAQLYIDKFWQDQVSRMRAIAAKAERLKSWSFMDGCFKQAMEFYVLASILYEKYPNHTIVSDGAFDHLGQYFLKNWDKFDPEFAEWYTVTAIDAGASTGCNVTEREPITKMLKIIVGDEYVKPIEKNQSKRRRIVRSGTRRKIKFVSKKGKAAR